MPAFDPSLSVVQELLALRDVREDAELELREGREPRPDATARELSSFVQLAVFRRARPLVPSLHRSDPRAQLNALPDVTAHAANAAQRTALLRTAGRSGRPRIGRRCERRAAFSTHASLRRGDAHPSRTRVEGGAFVNDAARGLIDANDDLARPGIRVRYRSGGHEAVVEGPHALVARDAGDE